MCEIFFLPLEDRTTARIFPQGVARLDWQNEVSRLFPDLDEALRAAPDEKARNVLIRRLRKALNGERLDDTT